MDWQDEVFAALDAIPNATASFGYPDDDWPDGTVITYSGLNDIPGSVADDAEYTTEITVKVDIWDNSPDKVKETVKLVKPAMAAIGFYRNFCCDLIDPGRRLHHTSMRFIRED